MTRLELAYNYFAQTPDDIGLKHRYHAVFLDTDFFIPILSESGQLAQALRVQDKEKSIFVAFDTQNQLQAWIGINQEQANIHTIILSGHQLINELPKGSALLINPMSLMTHLLTDEHVVYLKGVLEKISQGAH
jgi:hypothetical protein